ncbi:MAG: Fic family protein, partial [Flavobacterium sp.]
MLAQSLKASLNDMSQQLADLRPFNSKIQSELDKKFRLEFNFNSNHLEGNTLTYNETELLLIFDQTDGSHEYRELMEMEAHDVALKMIEEESQDKERPLTEQFIRMINLTLLVKPFWKDAKTVDGQATRKQIIPGKYKETPNSVQLNNGEMFHYTLPGDVPNEMGDLVKWVNSNPENYDPIELAAMLHYKFVRVHPFDDGNGRTARLLMNYILMRNGLPMVVIKSTEKKEYLTALNKADVGDLSAFVNYIGTSLIWSFNISLKAARGESIEEVDDIMKEIDLLVKDLSRLPDEYDKRYSALETHKVLVKSSVPIFIQLNDRLSKIVPLFVESKQLINLNIRDNKSLSDYNYEIDIEKAHNLDKLEEFDDGETIRGLSIGISLFALKKATDEV